MSNEREETEVKKNKKWLRDRYESMETIKATTKNSRGKRSTSYLKKRTVINLLNQLDEPEVLSQEWIERNTSPVDDEGRLYVWKSDLQNAIVPKQELPVIPKFVADWIEGRRRSGAKDVQIIEEINSTRWMVINGGDRKIGEYINRSLKIHGEVLRAVLVGYTVEEQKYYVEDGKHALLCKWESLEGWKVISTIESTEDDIPIEVLDYGLTEQEIKDYDPRFWPFRKPVEELEE